MTSIDYAVMAKAMAAEHRRSVPYMFGGPYKDCYRNRAMCMDERHVYTVFEVLMAWEFEHALELGGYDGASTTAFVESLRQGHLPRLTVSEVRVGQSLCSVLDRAGAFASLLTIPSWELLAMDGAYDFILVDANHDMESVSKELEHILRRQPLCVMAHDTNATDMGYPRAEGARHLRETLRKHPAYQGKCIEDAVRREGEETHRGLFLATTNPDLFKRAREAFAKWCPVLETVT